MDMELDPDRPGWFYEAGLQGKDDVSFMALALGTCHTRFPGRLPGCKAALPATCCALRRRWELCWAESRLLPHNSYLCVAAVNLLIVHFAAP